MKFSKKSKNIKRSKNIMKKGGSFFNEYIGKTAELQKKYRNSRNKRNKVNNNVLGLTARHAANERGSVHRLRSTNRRFRRIANNSDANRHEYRKIGARTAHDTDTN